MAASQKEMNKAMKQSKTNNNQLLFKSADDHDSINNQGSSSFDYDDFPLDDDGDNEGECKEDYFDTHFRRESISNTSNSNNSNSNNAAWVQLLNLPPPSSSSHHHHGVPVGGMRRVSSCYFSIASNLSNDNNSHSHHTTFHSPNPSYHNSSYNNSYHHSNNSSSGHSVLSFEGRNASDFLLHDVLMNVFSFLDAKSLASFSETGRRPNFEVFYFLELQLQRALLMGEGNTFLGNEMFLLDRVNEEDHHEDAIVEQQAVAGGEEVGGENDDDGSDVAVGFEMENDDDEAVGFEIPLAQDQFNNGDDEESDEQNDENGSNLSYNDDKNDITDHEGSNAIASFEGSIAGTGVISRLSSLDNAMARKIVQTYLDSNTSLHAMPLSHSLAYFRQVLLRQHPSLSSPFQPKWRPAASMNNNPNNTDNMAKNARNMALFFTFLGAAYMHAQQGGDVPNMPMPPITMPDPSEVLNEENMEAFKNMMLKVGLAGSFFKAGKTMKERQQQHQANTRDNAALSPSNIVGDDTGNDNVAVMPDQGDDSIPATSGENGGTHGSGMDASADSTAANDYASDNANESARAQQSPPSKKRSSSIGSIEMLSHMMPRLYNPFSNNASNSSLPNTTLNENLGTVSSNDGSNGYTSQDEQENNLLPKRKHRSKRSHKTIRHGDMASEEVEELNYVPISEEKKSAEPGLGDSVSHAGEEEKPHAFNNETSLTIEKEHSPEAIAWAMDHPFSPNPYEHPSSSTLNTAAAAVAGDDNNPSNNAASFFSFNMRQESLLSIQQQQADSGNVPSGCVGAYAHAVKSAATEVTRLVKLERKTNFDSLPPDEQLELGVRFIDACTSDTKLHIVKEILQKHKNMDVDRFFIGPDDTETCALHAAAFNGAENVLQFLCGGIDERDPTRDCGLCDVNVRDANGWTALHFAAGANSVTSVRVLAENGAKLTIEASNGYTPYHWAERLSNEEVAAELERLGADNRFVGRWMFGGTNAVANAAGDDRRAPFVSFLANRFFS